MHEFYYEFQATTSAAVCQCGRADYTLSPHLSTEWIFLYADLFHEIKTQGN
jgi:hypothetical protein